MKIKLKSVTKSWNTSKLPLEMEMRMIYWDTENLHWFLQQLNLIKRIMLQFNACIKPFITIPFKLKMIKWLSNTKMLFKRRKLISKLMPFWSKNRKPTLINGSGNVGLARSSCLHSQLYSVLHVWFTCWSKSAAHIQNLQMILVSLKRYMSTRHWERENNPVPM